MSLKPEVLSKTFLNSKGRVEDYFVAKKYVFIVSSLKGSLNFPILFFFMWVGWWILSQCTTNIFLTKNHDILSKIFLE